MSEIKQLISFHSPISMKVKNLSNYILQDVKKHHPTIERWHCHSLFTSWWVIKPQNLENLFLKTISGISCLFFFFQLSYTGFPKSRDWHKDLEARFIKVLLLGEEVYIKKATQHSGDLKDLHRCVVLVGVQIVWIATQSWFYQFWWNPKLGLVDHDFGLPPLFNQSLAVGFSWMGKISQMRQLLFHQWQLSKIGEIYLPLVVTTQELGNGCTVSEKETSDCYKWVMATVNN